MDANVNTPTPILIADGAYEILRHMARGDTSDVYLGVCTISNIVVAIKVEPASAAHPQLENEIYVYKSLGRGICLPRMLWSGPMPRGEEATPMGEGHAMVLDLLGTDLATLLKSCGGTFSEGTVLFLAHQLICHIEFLHTKSFIHCDIKPENVLVGLDQRGAEINLIDFGLSKHYLDPETGSHIPETRNNALTGKADYASINSHLGIAQSRRDDLESLGYLLLYFLNGSLPWQILKADTDEELSDLIMEKKKATPTKDLCDGFPEEFATYLDYVRGLAFDAEPDYTRLQKLFRGKLIGAVEQGEYGRHTFSLDWRALTVSGDDPRNAWLKLI